MLDCKLKHVKNWFEYRRKNTFLPKPLNCTNLNGSASSATTKDTVPNTKEVMKTNDFLQNNMIFIMMPMPFTFYPIAMNFY